MPRVEGIGGGADLLSFSVAVPDVAYPASLLGLWQCTRSVVAVEGDVAQAQGAWFDLGGTLGDAGDLRRVTERYYTRFVPPPSGGGVVVLDRAFELESRIRGARARWNASDRSSTTSYAREPSGEPTTELVVVRRRVEDLKPGQSVQPGDAIGFGFDELVKITTPAGGLFGAAPLVKAARVQRRYRRAFTESGERVVDGLEIVKTFRVLDGVAGVELPTSSARSTLRLTRPSVAQLKADGVRPFEVGADGVRYASEWLEN